MGAVAVGSVLVPDEQHIVGHPASGIGWSGLLAEAPQERADHAVLGDEQPPFRARRVRWHKLDRIVLQHHLVQWIVHLHSKSGERRVQKQGDMR